MSLAGFGGVLGWARRSIVDQHRWMTAEEFNETFALCHILPGPNIVNLSFVFGSRFGGFAGGCAGLRRPDRPADGHCHRSGGVSMRTSAISTRLRRALAGVACAAVGLLIAVVLRMMWPLIKKRDAMGMLILVAVFIAIGVLQLPLQTVVLVGDPLSLVITYFLRMRGPA